MKVKMKVAKIFTAVLVASIIVASGCVVQPPPTSPTVPPTSELPNPKLAMASAYKPTQVSFTPSSPPYSLPLDLNQLANSEQIKNAFNLNAGQEALLKANGFVVTPQSGDDIVEPYKNLKDREVPIFVTCTIFSSTKF
jgi:hypothetical protein